MADDLWDILPPRPEREPDLPPYSAPGRILVEIVSVLEPGDYYRYDAEVHSYDEDASPFWIKEGEGFDYWLKDCDFPAPGWYVVEGIKGDYIRGNGWTTDDEVRWEFASIRPASPSEIAAQTLDAKP